MYSIGRLLTPLTVISTLILTLTIPMVASAAPTSSHASITLSAAPERPVVNEEVRLTVVLNDKQRQPILNANVLVRADMIMTGMAGMQHGSSSAFSTPAKPATTSGEYVAVIKVPDEGDWKITAVSGDAIAELKVSIGKPQPKPTTSAANPAAAPLTSTIPVKLASSSVKASSMEAVHASYLELTGNISDLRSRVDRWKKGDADSQKIAEEKAERIEVVLTSISWPEVMAKAVMTTTQAMGPVAKALKDKDLNQAELAAKALGDGSHDVTHAFYGDWLPSIEGIRFSPMAPHAIYLDLSANIADLRSRIDQWQKGDEASLNIAKEKVERIAVLLPHLSASGMLLKPVNAIDEALLAVEKALDKKDLAAAQASLKPISDASHDLTHDFYSWIDVSSGGNDLACVLAAYRDLTANITDLRGRIGLWQQGDEDSYKIAQEKLERIEGVLAHPTWPGAMAKAVGKTEAAVQAMAQALEDKDLAAAEAASKVFGDGSHDVTHDYFGNWLPSIQLGADEGQVATAQGKTVTKGHDDGHGGAEEASGPNYYFAGSVIGVVLITIVLVPILRRRESQIQTGEAA